MNKPKVIVTVSGFGSLTVDQLRALVQQIDVEYARYTETCRYEDGDIYGFGLESSYEHASLRIVPNLDVDGFRLDKPVTEFKVISYVWEGHEFYSYDYETIRDAILKFVESLETAIHTAITNQEFPEYTKPTDEYALRD